VIEQSTKTRAGLRTVPLSEMAVASLLAWQLRQAAEAEAATDAWRGDGHVFANEIGAPLDPAYVTRLFRQSANKTHHCRRSLSMASGTAPPP
jgi:hypothetical protein